jgi:hypothetical protein
VTPGYNSSIRNLLPGDKSVRIKNDIKKNTLISLKLIIMSYMAKEGEGDWDAKMATKHGHNMLKILLDIYKDDPPSG